MPRSQRQHSRRSVLNSRPSTGHGQREQPHQQAHNDKQRHSREQIEQLLRTVSETPRQVQRTRLQDRMTRDDQPRRVQRPEHSSQSPSRPSDQRPSRSLQQGQQGQQHRQGRLETLKTPTGRSRHKAAQENENSDANQSTSVKRKRSGISEDKHERQDHPSKKHQPGPTDTVKPSQSPHRRLSSRSDSLTKLKAATTTPINKTQSQPLQQLSDQLPTPPSSNATPERQSQQEIHDESKDNLQKKVRTPVQTGKDQRLPKPLGSKFIAGAQDGSQCPKATQAEPGSNSLKYKETSSITSLLTTTQAAQATPSRSSPDIVAKNVKKRQRNDTEVVAQSPKRLRQSSDTIPPLTCTTTKAAALVTEGSDSAAPASMKLAGKQRTAPHQRPRAQAVQPESSFAPVAPNPECDFKLLDYDDNSVPVLYSTTITHTDSTELLNSPPEELVFDALDAVERGFKPDQYGWPSAIGLLGRKPNRDMPTKVLSDIDLYLHESDGKLYVATDQGLIIVAQYLKLIGVPDTQPVRFNGRIPPWAKAALNAREKRRVVRSFGSFRETAGSKTAERVSEERDGNLSLKLGSSVVVYKIDENDEWAYGRSCEDDKKGWFPISYTCPVDWSLDRFSGSNAALLDMPLPNSNDKEEKDWQGLLHWYRQKGFPEPTPVVTTAAANISQVVAPGAPPKASEINAGSGTIEDPVPGSIVDDASSGIRVIKIPVDQPAKQVITAAVPTLEPPENDNAEPPATASEGTCGKKLILDTTPGSTITRDKAQVMRSEMGENTEKTEITHPESVVLKHNIEPTDTDFEAPPQARHQLKDARETMNKREVGSKDSLNDKEREASGQQSSVLTDKVVVVVEAEIAEVSAPYNPFTVPRYDLFGRNDDIEVDWDDDSDPERL